MRVSIIVNNYNYERYLGEAIQSAVAQDHDDVEVVVVDDGSSDGSRRIIRSFGDKVRAVLKPNGGQASAFNAGVEVASGQFVVFLDADDRLLPHAARRVTQIATGQAGLAKITWRMTEIDSGGRATGCRYPRHGLDSGDCRPDLIRHGPFHVRAAPTSANAFPRRLLDELMPMPETAFRTCADGYLLLLAPLFGRIAVASDSLSCYRRHQNNSLNTGSEFERVERLWENYRLYREILLERLAQQGVDCERSQWHTAGHYLERVMRIADAIESTVPPGGTFVLIDEDRLNAGVTFRGRRRRYLLEHRGSEGGLPGDDAFLDRILEQHRRRGATHLAITGDCFWWLDHYESLGRYLQRHAAVVTRDASVAVWQFR